MGGNIDDFDIIATEQFVVIGEDHCVREILFGSFLGGFLANIAEGDEVVASILIGLPGDTR